VLGNEYRKRQLMMVSRSLLAGFVSLLLAVPVLAGVEGVVRSSNGVAIEAARIDALGEGAAAFSDGEGEFELPEVEPPVQLVVSHPRFHAQTIDLKSGQISVEVVLVAKQEIFEEIVVSANRGESGYAPVSVSASVVDPEKMSTPPATVAEMVVEVPGVSENGQGGLFQVYSIRGISRHRVLTLLEGARIVSDRRAGVSASFIDPQLLGSVDVVRGPSSTYYGSGALGGVVQLFPQRFETLTVRTGYKSQGDENYQAIGWGRDGWSVGLARRDAGRAEDPDGEVIPSGFTQFSGTLRRSWERDGLAWDALLLASAGREIEKASTDYPDRVTVYPEENHLLARLGVTSVNGWSLFAWGHPNDVETDVLRVGESRTQVLNESTEMGASWQQRFELQGASSLAIGAEYFGRTGVNADESVRDFESGSEIRLQTLDGASEHQFGAWSSMEWRMREVSAVAGLRATWQSQSNSGFESREDSALSGFLGLVAPLGKGFELAANVGTGLRFASLSERFFTGTTGRGGVIGNPDLDPESSLSFDLGLRWYGEHLFFTASLFRNEIDDYIERIEIEEDLLSYVNLLSGSIEGVELMASYAVTPAVHVEFGGHFIEGEAEGGDPLADIPADRVHLGVSGQGARWGGRLRLERRSEKTALGSGEKATPAASLLSGGVSYGVSQDLRLTLSGENLLDEAYFNSADRKVPLSAGRSIGLALSWAN
jgi:iron complex outermembrane receptor protein